jgi:alkanesulfonate monooxygenase SsuD/methylene tetrahydromethanopterin reductase-like flavin-dependent oxidoreductase (luciferase family)
VSAGRFWAALGTGEASNEHITGGGWPRKDVRNARPRECVEVLRTLFDGEEVSHAPRAGAPAGCGPQSRGVTRR